MGYWGYPKYVPVAERRAKAERKIKKLLKKNPNMKPVIIEGAITKTWWGKAWAKNLEQYADYRNRIGRGRSYVRNRAVLDLSIDAHGVSALVQGSDLYNVTVVIKKMAPSDWKSIIQSCKGQFDTMQKILMGKFPKDLIQLFTDQKKGLFPTPDDISFSCSCPDSAYMCKHVAATLYGIGARFDDDPILFFTLRNININELITENVKKSKDVLLKKSKLKSSKIIDDQNLSDMFGIDLDDEDKQKKVKKKTSKTSSLKTIKKKTPVRSKSKPIRKKASGESLKKSPAKDKVRKKLKTEVKKTPQKLKPPKPLKTSTSDKPKIDVILTFIRRKRKGTTVADIVEKTGFDALSIRNCLYRLKQADKIEAISRGVYFKK